MRRKLAEEAAAAAGRGGVITSISFMREVSLAKKATPPTAPPPKRVSPRSVGQYERDLGHRIRLRRVEQKMSQDELGKKLGVSFQQVQKYEKGVNRIGAGRLEEIARALEVPVSFFFGSNGNGKQQQQEVHSLLAIDSSFSIRLLRAYASIKNDAVRRGFVSLMEQWSASQAVRGK